MRQNPLPTVLLSLMTALQVSAATPLENLLLRAVREARFDQVVDFGPANEDRDVVSGTAKPIARMPNIDLAVIQLDAAGRPIASANVLFSQDYPGGLAVPVTLDRGADSVRFRRWDIQRWNGGSFKPGSWIPDSTKGWTNQPALTELDDIVPGRERAAHQFMAPYPASLFKLLVAFHTFVLIDAGELKPDTVYTYSAPGKTEEARTIRDWLDPMITVSDNHATHALLQMLHRRGQIEAMNKGLRELGLETLQVNGTRASDGYGWQTDRIHMTAFDTARLLLLIDGPPGDLWKTSAGNVISARILSAASRSHLKKLLLDQGLNEALSTSNLQGHPNVRPGIPAMVPARWIDPTNGTVLAGGVKYGVDIRSGNALAEVTFAHKTGLTYNYASDAGIVTSLPGKPFRRYIIALFCNVGYRYTDESFAGRTRGPYADPISPIAYTQRIATLGKAIDDALKRPE